MADKASLVDQVKNLQRTNPDAKQAWWDYCDEHLGGVRDPAKHDASTLGQFVTAVSNSTLPSAPPSGSRPASAGARGGGAGAASWSDPAAAAAAWAAFAAAAGAVSAPSTGRLPDMVKIGQRHSQHWRTAWQTYCALYGTGYNDPAKYDETFLVGFTDYIGQLATADLHNVAAENGVTIDLDAKTGSKRPSSGSYTAAEPSSPTAKRQKVGHDGDDGDSERLDLVEKVKALQRSTPEAKAAWWDYCDEHLGGVKDPGRHDASTLQSFLAHYS